MNSRPERYVHSSGRRDSKARLPAGPRGDRRQTRLQGEAASGPARRPAGFAEEVVTVPRNELAQVTEAVQQDLTARPRVPLLFGGLASHDR
jgi:hypothetical protein